MFIYKTVKSTINKAEDVMNEEAKNGWRVIAVTANISAGFGVMITFEKEQKEENY